jgi:hypothetical protein
VAIYLRMGRHPHLITHTFALQTLNVPAESGAANDILEGLNSATVHEFEAHVNVLGHRKPRMTKLISDDACEGPAWVKDCVLDCESGSSTGAARKGSRMPQVASQEGPARARQWTTAQTVTRGLPTARRRKGLDPEHRPRGGIQAVGGIAEPSQLLFKLDSEVPGRVGGSDIGVPIAQTTAPRSKLHPQPPEARVTAGRRRDGLQWSR